MNFFNYCCQQQKRKARRRRYLEQDGEPMIPVSDSPKLPSVSEHSVSKSSSASDSINSAYLTMISAQCGSPHQDMMFAVVHNDKITLKRLIEKEETTNSWTDIFQFVNRSQRTVTPMEMACMLGYIDLVNLFLDNGCSPNLPTTAGRLLHTIMDTLKSGKINMKEGSYIVKRLCNDGCSVNIVGQNHKTPILLAAELGNVDIMQTLLAVVDPSILIHGDVPNGFTPLHMSAMRGDLDCVLAILKYCSPRIVNVTDSKGYTSLKLALVSMYKNITYMNNLIKESENKANESSQLQQLRQLQYHSVAIVEALLLHGAEINNHSDNSIQDTLLYQALVLVFKDETCEKFRHDKYSHTMQLVASTKLQDLNSAIVGNDSESKFKKKVTSVTASPYSGIVRLFVLFGADPIKSKAVWQESFVMRDTEVQQLIDEVFYFWENSVLDEQPKLIQLSKQVIRTVMAGYQTLHRIDELPLPPSLKAFIKLQCL